MAWHWAGAAVWARAPFAASVGFWTLQATALCRHSRLTALKQFHPDILCEIQPAGSFPLAEHWTFPQQLQGKQGRDHKKTGMQKTLTFRGLFPLYPFLSRGSFLIPLHLQVSIFTYLPLHWYLRSFTHWFIPLLSTRWWDARHVPDVKGSDGKSVCLQCQRPGFDPWVGKIPWRRRRQPTPGFVPGNFHAWRSLMGYSPWGRKESYRMERLHFDFQGWVN